MNIILGNSVTAYIIAACLDFKHEKFAIINDGVFGYVPEILYLKCDNEGEYRSYLNVFQIDYLRQEDYHKIVKIGYFYDGSIHDSLSDDAKNCYLSKQCRSNTTSMMSDGSNKFIAIDLRKIAIELFYKYPSYNYFDYDLPTNKDTIYNTIGGDSRIVGKSHKEYLAHNTSFPVLDYDFVYDCSNNNIKRYTANTIEYLTKTNDTQKEITNYYSPPTIYKHNNEIFIGRSATKSQIKQKDVINYVLFNKGNVKEF